VRGPSLPGDLLEAPQIDDFPGAAFGVEQRRNEDIGVYDDLHSDALALRMASSTSRSVYSFFLSLRAALSQRSPTRRENRCLVFLSILTISWVSMLCCMTAVYTNTTVMTNPSTIARRERHSRTPCPFDWRIPPCVRSEALSVPRAGAGCAPAAAGDSTPLPSPSRPKREMKVGILKTQGE
jgi:hypothetical protein